MDLVTILPVFTNLKNERNDLNFVSVEELMKILYYELVENTINAFILALDNIDMIVQYHDFFHQ